TLVAFHFLIKNKLLIFALLTILSISFHNSAYIFFISFFLVKYKFNTYSKIFTLFIGLMVILYLNDYLFAMMGIIDNQKVEAYLENEYKSKLNILPILFQFGIIFSVLLIWLTNNKKLKEVSHLD